MLLIVKPMGRPIHTLYKRKTQRHTRHSQRMSDPHMGQKHHDEEDNDMMGNGGGLHENHDDEYLMQDASRDHDPQHHVGETELQQEDVHPENVHLENVQQADVQQADLQQADVQQADVQQADVQQYDREHEDREHEDREQYDRDNEGQSPGELPPFLIGMRRGYSGTVEQWMHINALLMNMDNSPETVCGLVTAINNQIESLQLGRFNELQSSRNEPHFRAVCEVVGSAFPSLVRTLFAVEHCVTDSIMFQDRFQRMRGNILTNIYSFIDSPEAFQNVSKAAFEHMCSGFLQDTQLNAAVVNELSYDALYCRDSHYPPNTGKNCNLLATLIVNFPGMYEALIDNHPTHSLLAAINRNCINNPTIPNLHVESQTRLLCAMVLREAPVGTQNHPLTEPITTLCCHLIRFKLVSELCVQHNDMRWTWALLDALHAFHNGQSRLQYYYFRKIWTQTQEALKASDNPVSFEILMTRALSFDHGGIPTPSDMVRMSFVAHYGTILCNNRDDMTTFPQLMMEAHMFRILQALFMDIIHRRDSYTRSYNEWTIPTYIHLLNHNVLELLKSLYAFKSELTHSVHTYLLKDLEQKNFWLQPENQ